MWCLKRLLTIKAGTGDGRLLVDAGMGAMPVVAVDPRFEVGEAFSRVLIEPRVGPFADGGLDEAFSFAVGARGVEARADGLDAEFVAAGDEAARAEAGAVIGHHPANGNAQAGKVSHRLAQEFAGGDSLFVWQQGGEGDAGVVIDGDIEELPSGATGFVLGISGEAMAGFGDASQLFDVAMQQVSRGGMLVTKDGNGWLQRASGVESQAGEDAADGGTAQTGGLGDAHAGPALTTQRFDKSRFFCGDTTGRVMRARRAIAQSGGTALAEATHPLGDRLPAQFEGGRGLLQTEFSC